MAEPGKKLSAALDMLSDSQIVALYLGTGGDPKKAARVADELSGFEKYSKPIYRFIDKISITHKGRIGFNKSICAKQNLNQYNQATLYWNSAENEIGIELTEGESDPQKPKLIFDKRGYGAHLNALNFFLTYNVDLGKANGQYEYRKVSVRKFGIEHDGYMFILKLPSE
jgi:hypothetical protein